MSYFTVSQCAHDVDFINRVSACVSQEGYTMDPVMYAQSIIWQVSSHSDIEAAYASALAADNPKPGSDPTVITDQMILSAVQPLMPKTQGPPNG